MGASSRMPGWWLRKVDYTDGSTTSDVVVMAISWGHEGGKELSVRGSWCWRRLGVVNAQIV
jgi:hypothetical protein